MRSLFRKIREANRPFCTALVAAGTHWEKQPTYGLTQTRQYSVDADGHVWVVLNRSDLADGDPAALLEDLGATLYAFEP